LYKFYYINLKTSIIRNNHIVNILNDIKLVNQSCSFTRVDAFDNKSITPDVIDSLQKNEYLSDELELYTGLKNKKKISIYMSHISIWKEILKEYCAISLGKRTQIPQYIILEDDVKINISIETHLDDIYKYIPTNYDILFLGYGGKLLGKQINPYIVKPDCGQHQDTNHGLFGYIINPNSIEKLNRLLLPIDSINIKGNWQANGSNIPHMDWKIRHFYNTEINAYYLIKPLILHAAEYENV